MSIKKIEISIRIVETVRYSEYGSRDDELIIINKTIKKELTAKQFKALCKEEISGVSAEISDALTKCVEKEAEEVQVKKEGE